MSNILYYNHIFHNPMTQAYQKKIEINRIHTNQKIHSIKFLMTKVVHIKITLF